MTFYEAALRVLEEAGAPLHSLDITKRAIDKGLLSHVGKTPEVTMLSRLAAIARRPRDRKILVTSRDTFALSDWLLPEDPQALEQTGMVEPNPEEGQPPYRPVERHPEPRSEYLRSIGRQADRERKRRGDDEGKRKKYPPLAEVTSELLQETQGPLSPAQVLARLKEKELVDEVQVGQLVNALAEENQRRVDQGRRPGFTAVKDEAGEVQLSLDAPAEGGPTPAEALAAFAAALGLPFEDGRLVLRGRGPASPRRDAGPPPVSGDDAALAQAAKHAARDARRSLARSLRALLGELDLGTFEKACVKLLHGLHFRELKLARRSKEGPTLTGRKKDGSLELRFAVRILRGNAPVERRHVQELRRELGGHGANVGLIVSPGEARGEARSEAVAPGGLVFLWCGDALAERFFEAQVGVVVTTLEVYAIDAGFFERAQLDAEEAQKRREDRLRERGERPVQDAEDQPEERSPAAEESRPTDGHGPAEVGAAAPSDDDGGGDDGEGDDDEGPEEEGVEASSEGGATGLGPGPDGKKRRRRRRRRRRGAGRLEGQSGGAQAAPPAEGGAPPAPVAEYAPEPAAALPPPPPPDATDGST
jgi:hypothetical protein